MVDFRNAVGSNIRHYRKSKGLSQDQLAELCGFHYSYIGGVERGERNISLDNLEKDATIDDLLAILQAKDLQYIRMTKKLLVEIFKTFSI